MNDASQTDLTKEAKAQKERVAENVNGVADDVRERASDAPGSDKAAEVVSDATERMKTGVDYAKDRDFSSMGNAVVETVKNNPVKTAIAGAVGAVLIALKLRSGSDESDDGQTRQ